MNQYSVKATRVGDKFVGSLFSGQTLVKEGIEGKDVNDVNKKAKAFAASHKVRNTPAAIETYEHEFHL